VVRIAFFSRKELRNIFAQICHLAAETGPIHRRSKASGYYDIDQHFPFSFARGEGTLILAPLQIDEPGGNSFVVWSSGTRLNKS
jgi:hypothetical protein